MKKVLLINPPQKTFKDSRAFEVHFPIALMYLAAMVKEICDIKIYDCLVDDFEVKKEKDFIFYGASFERVREVIREFKPNIVGITCCFFTQVGAAVKISRICKEIDPNIITILGGHEISIKYNKFLNNNACDYCVVGEGENTFFEFVKLYPSISDIKNIKGIAFKEKGSLQFKPREFIANLDDIPFPAYDTINVKNYLRHPDLYRVRSRICKNSITMITSRGCPFNCIFCSINLHMGKKYRAHSHEYILNHLKYCKQKLGISNFHFEDDNLSFEKQRFTKILDGIIKEDINIKWDTPNGIRIDSLNYETLAKMKQSGCHELMLSLESGNQRVLKEVINKETDLEYMIEVIRHCKQIGIRMGAFFVIGLPGETKDEIMDTFNLSLELLRKYEVLPALLFAVPMVGTDLYYICKKEGYIDKEIGDDEYCVGVNMIFGDPWFSTRNFTKVELKAMAEEFLPKLTKGLVRYSLKHPIYCLRQIIATPKLVKEFLYSLNSK